MLILLCRLLYLVHRWQEVKQTFKLLECSVTTVHWHTSRFHFCSSNQDWRRSSVLISILLLAPNHSEECDAKERGISHCNALYNQSSNMILPRTTIGRGI